MFDKVLNTIVKQPPTAFRMVAKLLLSAILCYCM